MTATVYCFGHVSTGKMIRIKGKYPSPDGYGEILEVTENYCGEALSTSVVLKRLGIDVILEGNWIGDNESGRRTLDFLKREGIEVSRLMIKKDYPGVEEFVISDSESRTVFGRYENLLFTERQWTIPDRETISNASVVCTDPGFGEESLKVAEIAQSLDIPYVLIDEDCNSPVIRGASVCIISANYLERRYPDDDPEEIFRLYQENSGGLIVFTFGGNPLWYGRTGINRMNVFPADVKETAGAGESFRAGIVYGLLQGMNDTDMIRFSLATASLVVQSGPGVLGFTNIEDIRRILSNNPQDV